MGGAKSLFVFSLAVISCLGLSLAGEVIDLTDATFEHQTQAASGATTGNWFVEFYAPWCGFCKKLAPIWEELAQTVSEDVNIARVDATENKGLAQRFDIKGYPTLLFFHKEVMYKYAGDRTIEALTQFAVDGFKHAEGKPVPPVPSVFDLVKNTILQALFQSVMIFQQYPRGGLLIATAGACAGGLVMLLVSVCLGRVMTSKKRHTD